jgi:TolB-like protein
MMCISMSSPTPLRIGAWCVDPRTGQMSREGEIVRVEARTVADMARSLGVAYILDGSVRKSGSMLRISVRLVRAADGYVAWSETYDRPAGDKLWVQEDIANEVARALGAAI